MNLNSCTISFMRSITISWFDFPIYNIYAIMSVIILNEYFSFKEKLNLSMKRTNFKNIFHTNLYFMKRALRILRIQFRTKCDGKFPFTKTISYLVHVEECPTTWYKYRSVSGTWKINRIHGFNRLDTSSWYTIGFQRLKLSRGMMHHVNFMPLKSTHETPIYYVPLYNLLYDLTFRFS